MISVLIRFSVGNFLSFKEIQEFSMIKGKTKNKSERIFDGGKLKLLKFAAIFGANASGKSNLVSSLKYAQETIVDGIYKKNKHQPFKLDARYADKTSYFEFEILINNNSYAYGFEIHLRKKQIEYEWLIQLSPTGNDKIIFNRDTVNGTFQSDLKIAPSVLRDKFDVYSDDYKSNSEHLFLKEMNRAKGELYKEKNELTIIKEIFEWFRDRLDVNYPDRPISSYSYFIDGVNKDEICRVISSLGTGITGYGESQSSLKQIQQQLPKFVYEQLEEEIYKWKAEKKNEGKSSAISIRINDMYYIISKDKDDTLAIKAIVFNHGDGAFFEYSEESDGTRRILDLLEILFSEEDKVYIIDEIDRSLHPQLSYKFVQEFLIAARKKNIQLIITTHESRLMDFSLLRQDEIWIANKTLTGETELYSLDEYNVRFDKKVDKAYLEGRYGGVPIFTTTFSVREGDN